MRTEDAIATGSHAVRSLWDALDNTHGITQFDASGIVLEVNQTMLGWLGCSAHDIVGTPFAALQLDKTEALSWSTIVAGEQSLRRERRTARDGGFLWLQSSYSPVLDPDGAVCRIIQIATNVSQDAQRELRAQGQLSAIRNSHALITFDVHGLILDANDIFLDTMGYTLDEIVGRHHRTFVEPSFAHGAEYALFWRELAQGRHQAGQYRRFAKNGAEIWLQAIYNPVFDRDGAPIEIVKIATPITAEKRRQAEHQGQIAAIHKSLCVISFDLAGIIQDANDNFLDATGYRLSELRGRHHRMFVSPEDAISEPYQSFWNDLAAGRHHSGEYKRIDKAGVEIWLQATYNPVLDLNGQPFRVVKYATVVTDQKLRQADLQGQISAIGKSQGLISFDLQGNILHANENFALAVGYDPDELRGRHHRVLVDPSYAASAEYAEFWNTLRTGKFISGLYRRIGKNGKIVWIQASYNPILDLNGNPSRIVKFATDVTSNIELAEAYEVAKRQSQHDPATALPNRVRLLNFMTTILAQPDRHLTVLYLDLDRFKPINDRFGHQAGDRVLCTVADRLRRALASDQLAARIGGDEFVIAAPDLDQIAVQRLCHRIIESISDPISLGEDKVNVGASIGVASTADGRSPDELLRCADNAMYRSKQSGRGTFNFYSSDLGDGITAIRSLSDEVHRGLAQGEFALDYQPRFDSSTDRIVSVEALIRWHHPTRGLIPPLDFIPSAERSGMIVHLGNWVLREACRTVVGWEGVGISVNVSPAQFQSPTLIETVASVLAETGLAPAKLELEITEGVIHGQTIAAVETLAALKQLGVRISMDDFGSGLSCLSSLRAFPFDAIKIDRQFIHEIDTSETGREVVQAILALARALCLTVTAEGVETPSQRAMLTDGGCTELQGFLLARPMPADQVVALLKAKSPRPAYIRRVNRKSSSNAA